MKRFYILSLIILGTTLTLSAQESLKVVDSIFFKSDNSQDQPFYRLFGFGSGHTNQVDTDEVAFPTLPPFGTLAAGFVDQDLSEKYFDGDFMQSDIRGLPDSVSSGKTKQFWLEYEINFQRGTGQSITVGFPIRLARGIDSINIEDVEGLGNVFHYTYSGAENTYLYTIPNNELRFIRMRVYYNISTASVAETSPILHTISLVPNPLRSGENATIMGNLPAGSRVLVTNLLGEMVLSHPVYEEGEGVTLNGQPISSGTYIVSVIGKGGELLGRSRLVVIE